MSFENDPDFDDEIAATFDELELSGRSGSSVQFVADPTRSFTFARSAAAAAAGDTRISLPTKRRYGKKQHRGIVAAGRTLRLRAKEKLARQMCRTCMRQGVVLNGDRCVNRNSCQRYINRRAKMESCKEELSK